MMRAMLVVAMLALVPNAWAEDKAEGEKPADDGLHPRVKMETTLGDIILEIDAEKAPITVQNFVRYAQEGFYDGTIFHRVMHTFMIQGGGYTPEMEKKEGVRPGIKNEWRNGLKNVRGSISMARMGGDPHSGSSQFFINVVDNANLDQPQRDGAAYAVFGKVVEGLDVVDKIRDTEVTTHPKLRMGKVVPAEPVIVKAVKIVSTYDAEKVATKVAEATSRIEVEAAAAKKVAEEAEAKARAEQEKALQEVIKKVEEETGKKIEKTASGLGYVVLKEGEGPAPKSTDTVEVNYIGWLLDGTKFDASADHGGPATFPLNRVIPGWTEGVGMMKIGEKRKLIVPAELAYGKRGRPGIPPNSTLVFEIELLSIKEPPAREE